MSSRQQNSHVFYQDLLERHISDSSLTPVERIELFDHIEDCANCRRILEAEERVTARMKAVPKLVAPSDLRAKILSQAIRDHRERTTTPSEDPSVSDLLKKEEPADQEPVANTSTENRQPAKLSGRPKVQASQSEVTNSEIPVFAGRTRPTVSRARRIWRQASPALALSFLGVATVGALYTGQFQSIPFAAEAQQFVWKSVDKVIGREPIPSENEIADSNSEKEWLLYPAESTSQIILSKTQQLLDASAQVKLEEPAAPPPPLPGTKRMVALVQSGRGWAHSVNSTVEALARAATSPLPAPAESSAPQIAALILRPTDAPEEDGGFQNSALADTLENLADENNGARLASSDQFTQGGHRFRLYTLELPAGVTNRLVENLNPYECPEDQGIVTSLTNQKALTIRRPQEVRFFSSDEARLRSAIQLTANSPVYSPQKERIQFVVVE